MAVASFPIKAQFLRWRRSRRACRSRHGFSRAITPAIRGGDRRDLHLLAAQIKSVMARIDWALERPACNFVLHTAPLSGEGDTAFHWHLEILPRVTRFGGLEWGSGVHRNPVSPEEAARALRG
jgi:hypothetical protein